MNNDGSGIVLNYLTTTLNATSYTEGQQVNVSFCANKSCNNYNNIYN